MFPPIFVVLGFMAIMTILFFAAVRLLLELSIIAFEKVSEFLEEREARR